jgi:hypothetical protein
MAAVISVGATIVGSAGVQSPAPAVPWSQDSYELHHPTTGQTAFCTTKPYQIMPGREALEDYVRCIDQYQKEGFVPHPRYLGASPSQGK